MMVGRAVQLEVSKEPAASEGPGPRGQGPQGPRRPRPPRRRRRRPGRPRGRDRVRGGRAGQRADGARRGDHRHAPHRGRRDPDRRGAGAAQPAGRVPGRRRPRARGPPRGGPDPGLHRRREPDAQRVLPGAVLGRHPAPPGRDRRRSRRSRSASTTCGRPSIFNDVGNLSGGNQQKVIVAREFSRPIRLLVAAQPTRGLDVGSIEYIHKRVVEKRDEGAAVLLVSTELDEVMTLGDRIAVMYQGRIVDVIDGATATRAAARPADGRGPGGPGPGGGRGRGRARRRPGARAGPGATA